MLLEKESHLFMALLFIEQARISFTFLRNSSLTLPKDLLPEKGSNSQTNQKKNDNRQEDLDFGE